MYWISGLYSWSTEFAASRAFAMSVALIEDDRSMIIIRSTGWVGDAPHGPTQAAEVTCCVDPWLTPTARPKLKFTDAALESTIVLHAIPVPGTQTATQIPLPQRQPPLGEGPGLQTAGTSPVSGTPSLLRSPTRQR